MISVPVTGWRKKTLPAKYYNWETSHLVPVRNTSGRIELKIFYSDFIFITIIQESFKERFPSSILFYNYTLESQKCPGTWKLCEREKKKNKKNCQTADLIGEVFLCTCVLCLSIVPEKCSLQDKLLNHPRKRQHLISCNLIIVQIFSRVYWRRAKDNKNPLIYNHWIFSVNYN